MKRILTLCALALMAQAPAPSPIPTPPPSFDSQTPPAAPDYAVAASWAARSGAPGASAMRPTGAAKVVKQQNVDVFYLHPTTYRSPDRWNLDLSNAEVNRWTDASVIARQAGVFNACCRVFAPRYREASFLGSQYLAGEGAKAFDLAYSDVLRAFRYYIAHDNKGRPFILAGHSQGAYHLMRLLEEEVDGKPLARKLVTAYVLGVDVMEGDFGRRFKQLKPCDHPEQTGCVLSWNAVTPQADLKKLGSFAGAGYAKRFGTQEGRSPLCINPLTFSSAQPNAEKAVSKGAVPGNPGEGPMLPLKPGLVSAQCKDGFLVVMADPSLDLKPSMGVSMHYHEYGLFYADIQANLAKRIKAFPIR